MKTTLRALTLDAIQSSTDLTEHPSCVFGHEPDATQCAVCAQAVGWHLAEHPDSGEDVERFAALVLVEFDGGQQRPLCEDCAGVLVDLAASLARPGMQ